MQSLTAKLNLIRSYLISFHNIEMSVDEIRRLLGDRKIRSFGAVPLADEIAHNYRATAY